MFFQNCLIQIIQIIPTNTYYTCKKLEHFDDIFIIDRVDPIKPVNQNEFDDVIEGESGTEGEQGHFALVVGDDDPTVGEWSIHNSHKIEGETNYCCEAVDVIAQQA